MLAVDLVRRDAARFAGRTAVHVENRSLTYAEVDEAANRLAHVLAGLGVGPGDRVGLLAVVGAPDATWVEAVTAFVKLRPGVMVSEAALRDHVRARLAGYKVPKTVHFVETIPYSPVGKILRRALRDPLWEGK
jgi:acyl-CoA synthetase (AMP-forming)/AMP-acid ligase II